MPLNTEKFKYINSKDVILLPPTTGVYGFKRGADFLYIGKAINIKERVKNHISQPTFKDNIFVPETEKIGFIATGSEVEALILEASLIKKYQPKYNTVWRDGKSHNFIAITDETFPRILITHQLLTINHKLLTSIGPFINGNSLRQTLRILRRVFPFRTCNKMPKKACLYKDLKLCPAPCEEKAQESGIKNRESGVKNYEKEYKRNIKNLMAILNGKKNSVIKNLQKEMAVFSHKQNFEKAKNVRDQIFAIENVFSHSHILKQDKTEATEWPRSRPLGGFNALQSFLELKNKIKRIEGYDISNIQGQEATGSMVVFESSHPNKNEYRKFKIKITGKPNDTAMLKEVISRRLKHPKWPMPQVMLIDGGKGQLNIGVRIKNQELRIKKIKMIALAKRKNELFLENKKKPILLKNLPQETANLILHIRDEAHRFAISYHKKLRSNKFLG